ncbi:GntR family transcriptional regulator [Ancylobacter terrae]|uniref:GntR family transcriptional regulator n=1 Tax=Ancylobacter sp. sgz301288 TaxID=3342077 RepID=UPI00385FF7CF
MATDSTAQPFEDDPLSAVAKEAPAPLRRKVLDSLRQSIVHGRLAPGSRLVERDLIERLNVSRTVIREALRQLESEGLIEVVPNKGAVVRKLTPAEARELYAIRGVLEGLAARLFCESASPDEIRQLEQALDRVVAAYDGDDPGAIIDAKNAFYEVLFQGSRNTILYPMIAALYGRIWRWRVLGLAHPNRSERRSDESVASMRALLTAIKTGEASKAEELARQEVRRAEREIMRLI